MNPSNRCFGILSATALVLALHAPHAHSHEGHALSAAAKATHTPPKDAVINPWSQGEVRRIDLAARKITLKHGFIATIGMDAMTMVFQLRDDAAFKAAQSLKVGDQIEFEAAYDKGAYLVIRIRPPQPR